MVFKKHVKNILHSPVYVFDEIIEKLTSENIHAAKIELTRHRIAVDMILVESVKSILKDLKEEEGVVSRFLYATFGFEIRKNKRREQLIYLGSELKAQHKKVTAKLYEVHRQIERLSYSVNDLIRLKNEFSAQKSSIKSEKERSKNRFYFEEIEQKIEEIEGYTKSLQMKHEDVSDVEKIYHLLLKRIPRYHELNEETHLLLLSPARH